jgi:hypothetical protein
LSFAFLHTGYFCITINILELCSRNGEVSWKHFHPCCGLSVVCSCVGSLFTSVTIWEAVELLRGRSIERWLGHWGFANLTELVVLERTSCYKSNPVTWIPPWLSDFQSDLFHIRSHHCDTIHPESPIRDQTFGPPIVWIFSLQIWTR